MRASTPPEPLSYGRQFVDQDDVDAVVEVLRGETLTQGEAVGRFEARLERTTGAAQAVAVANGTVALQLAYLALDAGPGTRVATTANTFLSTATAALHCGAEVTFLDVESGTANLDVDTLEAALEGPDPPTLVTVVHFAGLPVDMARILELRRRHGFLLVEDAAHALGARYRVDGRWWRVGEHPDVDATTLSFHPVKHVTTGEGGAVLTGSAELAARLRRLREHGIDRGLASPSFAPMVELGLNGRLSDLGAALGWSQLEKLPDFLAARREIALRYVGELRDYELLAPGGSEAEHAWHLFVVLAEEDERDELRTHLAERGIRTQVHYHPVPLQPWFRAHVPGGARCPRAEHHGRRAISLPIYPALSEAGQGRVVDALNAWRRRRVAA
jgi:dTDP-4-amino-4,6-dideoxygalactose transaminase